MQAAFRVLGEGDPRAFLVLGHAVESLRLEAGQDLDLRGVWQGIVVLGFGNERFSPRFVAVFADDHRGLGIGAAGGGGEPVRSGLDEGFLAAVGDAEGEDGDEAGDRAAVPGVDADFVFAGFEEVVEFRLGGFGPVGVFGDLLFR